MRLDRQRDVRNLDARNVQSEALWGEQHGRVPLPVQMREQRREVTPHPASRRANHQCEAEYA